MTSREDIYEIVRLNPSICVNEILPMVECGKSGVLRMLEGYIKYGMIRKGRRKHSRLIYGVDANFMRGLTWLIHTMQWRMRDESINILFDNWRVDWFGGSSNIFIYTYLG